MADAEYGNGGGHSPRAVALVGPYGSGKSTLFEALMLAGGASLRRADPRTRTAGTELRLGHCRYLGEEWAILDCPGSIEFAHEAEAALTVADIAVVVCEATPARARAVAPVLKALDDRGTPYLLFVNKMDALGDGHVRDTLAALQAHAARPLVLRQVPIREGERVTGYVDVASERAYRYRPGEPSELIQRPSEMAEREREAMAAMMEVLADHDDTLLEKVLEDVKPTSEEIYRQLHKDQAAGALVGVLLGAAERDHGVRRLWKALRHDGPDVRETAAARGIAAEGEPLAQVFKTQHAGHTGKLSYARIWRGTVREGASLNGERLGGLYRMPNAEPAKVAEAGAGEVVALARLTQAATGATLSPSGHAPALPFPEAPPPVYALAIATEDRRDDVKLSGALARLLEEDPALSLRHEAETGETVLCGQGEMHLKASIERIGRAHGLRLATVRPRVGFKETIRRAVHQHARLKRQTGGHGQFADVKLDIAPRGRGEGFQFNDRIVGGAVPRNFIPAVGEAAEEATRKGPLGYPVVDVSVTLVDGTFHAVDSSDMAFRSATRNGMQEALAKADPVLLEPIDQVSVAVPNDCTPAAQRLLSGRRGQILGYAEKPGWPGWDEVEALVPEAELHDLIIELRSLTMGLGTYRRRFDHLAEAQGRLAERMIAEATAAR
ncbi:MAG TPA: elongation factor G [Acetobacteraceae bacterium]|nr:elongation factor G [Acetobacteraceae bacterium]